MADYGLEYKGATKKESKDGIKSYTVTSDDPLWHLLNDRNDQVPNSSFNDGDRVKDKELGLGRISLSFPMDNGDRKMGITFESVGLRTFTLSEFKKRNDLM